MPSPQICDNPLVRVLVTRLRDRSTGPEEFRALLGTVTSHLLHEALADLALAPISVETPLMLTTGWALARPLAFVPILRAGLGMAEAAARAAPGARVWHLGLYRNEATLEPVVYYNRLAPGALADTTVVVLDPMLATAGSAIAAARLLKAVGATDLRFVGLVGAPEGVRALAEAHPDMRITLGALDERLTGPGDAWPTGYILPGLGDAGDRQFGT
jgi:uracil phosphoribosyltransferase